MATIQLQPPNPFDFKHPDDWPRWKRRFEQYRHASGLASGNEERQVSTLLYCLGEQADDVLSSTGISEENRKKYSQVLNNFDDYFKVRKNIIFERARFNRRNQLPGETAEEYVTVLFNLVDSCNYGELKDEMLRDRLVVGIRDVSLSERLQMDSELTLEKAMKMVRQKEAVHQHNSQLQGNPETNDSGDLSLLKYKSANNSRREIQSSRRETSSKKTKPKRNTPQAPTQCTRCGKDGHTRGEQCPASSVTCHKCKRKGHFASQCFSKTVRATADELSLDSSFLDAMTSANHNSWNTEVLLEKTSVNFKLDTGAEVTAITEKTFKLLNGIKLCRPAKTLHGPAKQSLKALGQFTGTLCHKENTSSQTIYVIRGLKTNLLGLPAIISLCLLCRINEMTCDAQSIQVNFPSLFKGLGTLGDAYTIKLKEGAVPYSLFTPRNVAIPLREKVKTELNRMETNGIISRVTNPTSWCAGMVVVPKGDGSVRICVDLKPLNQNVLREVHPIPKVDDTLAQLAGATIFSKIDANSGFWQIPLAEESRPLTTFVTPYGRYLFNKLPFGISCAPELFQSRMNKILDGLKGVVCQMDDVLVFGSNQAEHDQHLIATLERIKAAGVTLNKDKCKFSVSAVKFLGHVVNKDGIKPDPEKTSAIVNMKPPQNVSELRRFMGMANQLGKFSCHLADLTYPLRGLLSSKRAWLWGPEQEDAFKRVKEELAKPTVLALYQPGSDTKVSADASSYGLGAVLLQCTTNTWKPVAYASRALSETEKRYAQIEKEALAVTWACTKFTDYILGCKFVIESDHKPLIPLLNSKHLDSLPPRILRFRLRLAKFDYTVTHVPGKLLYSADALSRAPASPVVPSEDDSLQDDAELFVTTIVSSLPASKGRLVEYQKAQQEDPTLTLVKDYCNKGWPAKETVEPDVKPYWTVQNSLTLGNDLLLYNNRIVVPLALRKETIKKIHEGHQGIERCRQRALTSVWWPGVSEQVTQYVQQCPECCRENRPKKQPLLYTPLPDYPWQVVGTDLLELRGKHYLLVVDYFSRYPEIIKMTSTTSASTIAALKAIFSRHGIPEVVRSDNGPQYSSQEFAKFSKLYSFKHITSSPLYPQSNGQAERTVQTVKKILRQSEDIYKGLLVYRSTPLPWCKLSPAELSMGRRLRTQLPLTDRQLIPQWSYLSEFRKLNKKFKKKQERDYNRQHRARELPSLPDESEVWVTSNNHPIPGRVVTSADTPRSYLVETPSGQLRRNQQHLNIVPERSTNALPESIPVERPRVLTRSQTGTEIVAPKRFRT